MVGDLINALQVRPDTRLGGAAQAVHAALRGGVAPQACGEVEGNPVARQQHRPQASVITGIGADAQGHFQQCRGRIPQAHAVFGDQLRPTRRIAGFFRLQQHQASALPQHAKQVVHRQVEIQRRHGQQAIIRCDLQFGLHRIDRVDCGAMADFNTFGNAGRARGVDHIRAGARR